MRKQMLLSLALTLGMLSPALAQSFESYDTNGDGNVTKDEYYGSIADWGTYPDWDTSGDGLVDEEEFGALGHDWDYDTWDSDANGYVDSGEFYDGLYTTYDSEEDGHWQLGNWDDAGEEGWFDF